MSAALRTAQPELNGSYSSAAATNLSGEQATAAASAALQAAAPMHASQLVALDSIITSSGARKLGVLVHAGGPPTIQLDLAACLLVAARNCTALLLRYTATQLQ